MNKLRLDLDDLVVDTFSTGGAAPARGTVEAHEDTYKLICDIGTLRTDMTCCPCTPML